MARQKEQGEQVEPRVLRYVDCQSPFIWDRVGADPESEPADFIQAVAVTILAGDGSANILGTENVLRRGEYLHLPKGFRFRKKVIGGQAERSLERIEAEYLVYRVDYIDYGSYILHCENSEAIPRDQLDQLLSLYIPKYLVEDPLHTGDFDVMLMVADIEEMRQINWRSFVV